MSEFVKKLYAWCLNKVRFVAGSIRAFLPRVLPGKKKSIAFLKRVFFLSAVLLLACPVIMRTGGSMSTGLPVFSTTATYTLLMMVTVIGVLNSCPAVRYLSLKL